MTEEKYLDLTIDELERLIRPPVPLPRKKAVDPDARPTAFLSTSFQRWPQVSEQSRLISSVFDTRFQITGGWGVTSGPQLHKIIKAIRDSHVVLVEATFLSANIMFEMGIAYAFADRLKKRVFLMFNASNSAQGIMGLPDYVRSLDIISYTFERESLLRVRDKIYERLQLDPEPEEIMSVNIRGNTLRPRSDSNGVYLYYPPGRSIWTDIIDYVRTHLEKSGCRLYTSIGAPSGSTRLQEVIYCVSRSSRTLSASCFIDTTAPDGVDLIGSFALGAAIASRRGVRRFAEADGDHPERLSLLTEHLSEWSSREDLVRKITQWSSPKPAPHRRRK